jgi:integrase
VIFRILYCCGTRINETLGIKKEDVDLDKGIIRLNEAKNDKQRYVVCGEDLRLLLNVYANRCFYLLSNDDYIFTNANGGRIDEKSVYENHRAFLRHAGIPYVGGGEGPRIHDWRHHMAVYSFKQLTDSGLDMYVALPILSTYLGHKTIFATEKYVRLTLQLFPYIEEKFRGMTERIFGGDADEEH